MQSVQGTNAMTAPEASLPSSKKVFMKWSLLGTVGIINGYATILMYSRGEIAFALLTLILTALALFIFGSKKTYAHRYIYWYSRDDPFHSFSFGVHHRFGVYQL